MSLADPLASHYVCAGCGAVVDVEEPYPFRCPAASSGDRIDHVLGRALRLADTVFPVGDEFNPFLRYRRLFHTWHFAGRAGLGDGDYCTLIRDLDQRVQEVEGRGFAETPFRAANALTARLGLGPNAIWIKDETENVGGSHKGRHLFAILAHLEVVARLGCAAGTDAPLAIASCGNAALAAAILARAAGRPLDVWVPDWADVRVRSQLAGLGARVHVCERTGAAPGDPCLRAFRAAVASGAIPFCCQGPENALGIEGGRTLAWEMVSACRRMGAALDRIFVQVGGGALASSVFLGLAEAKALGVWGWPLPRFHAVQTEGAAPLARAWDRLVARSPGGRPDESTLSYARSHRDEFMWPWEDVPESRATGILDDETYDWQTVVRAMSATGGSPVVVSEDEIGEAWQLGCETTGIRADPTGTSGLAGLLHQLRSRDGIGANERIAVLFTGVER